MSSSFVTADAIAADDAVLEMRLCSDVEDPQYPVEFLDERGTPTYMREQAALDVSHVDTVGVVVQERSPMGTILEIVLTAEGAARLADVTTRNMNRRLAIMHHGEVLLAPRIMGRIDEGRVSLSGIDGDTRFVSLLHELEEVGVAVKDTFVAPPFPTEDEREAALSKRLDEHLDFVRSRVADPSPADSVHVMELAEIASVGTSVGISDAQAAQCWGLVEDLWPEAAPRDPVHRLIVLTDLISHAAIRGDLDVSSGYAEELFGVLDVLEARPGSMPMVSSWGFGDLAAGLRASGETAAAEALLRRALESRYRDMMMDCFLELVDLLEGADRIDEVRAMCQREIDASNAQLGMLAFTAERVLERLDAEASGN